jgi:hypothetical protein
VLSADRFQGSLQTVRKVAVDVHGKISAFGARANGNHIDFRRDKQGILLAMYHLIEASARNIYPARRSFSMNIGEFGVTLGNKSQK